MIEKINLKEKADSVTELFQYLEVGRLNDHILSVLQAEDRTLDFHIHEKSDEMFYCIEGEFDIEFDDGIVHLCEGDFIVVPSGMSHRPVCKGLVKCLLIEKDGTLTKENTGGAYGNNESAFNAKEFTEARHALLSLRNKNTKAAGKLKDGTWQNKLTTGIVNAVDMVLGLIDGNVDSLTDKGSLSDSHAALTDALQRAESVIGKFALGTSQHTLQKNRIAALKVALTLIERVQSQL